MNIILLEYRKGYNRNKEERERVKLRYNEKICGKQTDNLPILFTCK
jgi:hypothetical protein